MLKKKEDHCGLKTVYTPQGLKGDDGDPGTSLDTHVVEGHSIVLADIVTVAPDLTIDTFLSGTFDYKILENRMVWVRLVLFMDVTMAAGGDEGFLNLRIDNLPVTFGDPTGGGASLFLSEVLLSNPTYVSEASIAISGTGLGSDAISITRMSPEMPVGSHRMQIEGSGTVPGLII